MRHQKEPEMAGAVPAFGVLDMPEGTRPIDALAGVSPGLWLLAPAGLLGRVTERGKRVIIFGGTTA